MQIQCYTFFPIVIFWNFIFLAISIANSSNKILHMIEGHDHSSVVSDNSHLCFSIRWHAGLGLGNIDFFDIKFIFPLEIMQVYCTFYTISPE